MVPDAVSNAARVRDTGSELASGKLSEVDGGLVVARETERQVRGGVDHEPQGIQALELIEPSVGGSGIAAHVVAAVEVPRGDHAVERGTHHRKALLFLEAGEFGLGHANRGGGFDRRRLPLFRFFFGNDVRLQQPRGPVGQAPGIRCTGDGLFDTGARGLDGAVDLGRIHDGERVVGLHHVSNLEPPFPDDAGRAGENRGRIDRFRAAGNFVDRSLGRFRGSGGSDGGNLLRERGVERDE